MTGLFVFTAGDGLAQSNLKHSIENPISPEKVYDAASGVERAALSRIEKAAGGFYAWGARPRVGNERTWNKMSSGDLVLCVYEFRYRFAMTALAKYADVRLGRAIWDSGPDEPFSLMYFVSRPQPIDIHVPLLGDVLRRRYLGFCQVTTGKLVQRYRSVAGFAEQRLAYQMERVPQALAAT